MMTTEIREGGRHRHQSFGITTRVIGAPYRLFLRLRGEQRTGIG
jgi:hypothetical protein